jgi:hypothetical protein
VHVEKGILDNTSSGRRLKDHEELRIQPVSPRPIAHIGEGSSTFRTTPAKSRRDGGVFV